MNNPYLFRALAFTPIIISRLVGAIPVGQYDHQTDPGRFTLREAVAHLADWEPIFLSRIQTAIQSPGSQILGIDETERAIEQGYDNWAVTDTLTLFKDRRNDTIAFLENLRSEEWSNVVLHSEKGPQTIEDQASMLVSHDTYHIEHLTQFLESHDSYNVHVETNR